MTDLVSGPYAAPRPATPIPIPQAAKAGGRPATADSRSAATAHRVRRLGPGRRVPYARLLGPVAALALWSLASAVGLLDPRTLPAPWTVAHTAAQLWQNGTLGPNVSISLERALKGFAFGLLAGTALALLAGLSRKGEALIDGNVQIFRSVPILGLIPLLILWLGIGETFKVVTIALAVTIPFYVQLSAALSDIDKRFVELGEVLGLSRWQFVRQVVVPGALPGFFTGLRLGIVGSWLALVVVEQINATSGVGYMMFNAENYGQTDIIVVGLAFYGLVGFTSDSLVRLAERRVLSWRQTLTG